MQQRGQIDAATLARNQVEHQIVRGERQRPLRDRARLEVEPAPAPLHHRIERRPSQLGPHLVCDRAIQHPSLPA